MKTLILKEEFSLQFPHDIVERCGTFYDVEIHTSDVNDSLVNVVGKAVAIVSQKRYGFYMLSGHKFEPPDWWPKKEFEVKERLPWIDCIKAFFKGESLTYKKIETVYDDQVKLEGYYSFTIPVTQIKVIKDQ